MAKAGGRLISFSFFLFIYLFCVEYLAWLAILVLIFFFVRGDLFSCLEEFLKKKLWLVKRK